LLRACMISTAISESFRILFLANLYSTTNLNTILFHMTSIDSGIEHTLHNCIDHPSSRQGAARDRLPSSKRGSLRRWQPSASTTRSLNPPQFRLEVPRSYIAMCSVIPEMTASYKFSEVTSTYYVKMKLSLRTLQHTPPAFSP
jgi:hypothetical protein